MTADRPLLGIFFMLAFCALAPVGDAMAKILGSTIPIIQLLLVRFGMQFLILYPLSLYSKQSLKLPPRIFRLTVLRTIFHILGIGAMFTSLKYLELADAVAIAFVMPFIMLLLGRFVLNEEIGTRRMMACAVGFIGTLLVVQPSFVEVGTPALLPLFVAVVFALFMLVTRQTAKHADPIVLQTIGGLIALPILLVAGFIAINLGLLDGPMWLRPSARETWLLLSIGIVGTVAHLFMTWSLRFAPSATVAPMQYLEIPIATFIGWLVFKDLPNGIAAIGIVITIAAGLYVVFREQATSRAIAAAEPSRAPSNPAAD